MVSVLRQNWEFLFLLTHHQRQNCCHGNSTKGVILFLVCDAHLWCQVSTTLLQYFQRYRLFSIFHFFVANRMTSSLHNKKMSISVKRKKIFQKEKRHSSVFWKAFQISTKNFSFHRHFKKNKSRSGLVARGFSGQGKSPGNEVAGRCAVCRGCCWHLAVQ